MHQTTIAQVHQRLVDDARRAGREGPQPLDVVASKPPQGLGRPFRGGRTWRTAETALDQLLQIRRLAGGVDLGMGGQDLLDQGAARARHADDQHGRGIRIPLALHAVQEGAVEGVGDLVQFAQDGGFVVMEGPALQGVGEPELLERAGMIAGVGEGLAEREAEFDLPLDRERPRLGKALHRGDMGIAGLESAGAGEVVIKAWLIRRELDRTLELGDRLILAAELVQQDAPVAVRSCQGGRGGDGRVETGQGFVGPKQSLQGQAPAVHSVRIVGLERQHGVEAGQGRLIAAEALQADAPVEEGRDVAGLVGQHRVVGAGRLGQVASVHQDDGPAENRRDVVGLDAQRPLVAGEGLLQPAELIENDAPAVRQPDVARRLRQPPFETGQGLGWAPQPRQDLAAHLQGVERAWQGGQRLVTSRQRRTEAS